MVFNKKIVYLLFIIILIIFYLYKNSFYYYYKLRNSYSTISGNNICIIGGGLSGLASAKNLFKYSNITIYEKKCQRK